MHSWRTMRDLLEAVGRPGRRRLPGRHGALDALHPRLQRRGRPHPARRTTTGPTPPPSTPPTAGRRRAAPLDPRLPRRPERRHRLRLRRPREDRPPLPRRRPERPPRRRQARRLLAARRERRPDEDDAPHLLGRLHAPERGDGGPGDLEQRPRRHGQGPRRPRLDASDDDGQGPQHRHDRLRLHGPLPLQRLPHRPELLRPAAPPGAQGRLRPRRGEDPGLRRPLGLRERRDRLAQARRAPRHRPRRHLRPERPARGDRHRRRRGRQDRHHREADRPHHRRGRGDGRRGREGRRAEPRLLQLPPHAGGQLHQADRRLRQARPHLPLPRQVPAGLDDLARRAAGRARAPGGSTSRRPAPASPATCSPTASTPRSGSTARSRA